MKNLHIYTFYESIQHRNSLERIFPVQWNDQRDVPSPLSIPRSDDQANSVSIHWKRWKKGWELDSALRYRTYLRCMRGSSITYPRLIIRTMSRVYIYLDAMAYPWDVTRSHDCMDRRRKRRNSCRLRHVILTRSLNHLIWWSRGPCTALSILSFHSPLLSLSPLVGFPRWERTNESWTRLAVHVIADRMQKWMIITAVAAYDH